MFHTWRPIPSQDGPSPPPPMLCLPIVTDHCLHSNFRLLEEEEGLLFKTFSSLSAFCCRFPQTDVTCYMGHGGRSAAGDSCSCPEAAAAAVGLEKLFTLSLSLSSFTTKCEFHLVRMQLSLSRRRRQQTYTNKALCCRHV
jgi:hypothetical protein